MSAYGPKRTSLVAPHMSAFEGKADMTICACQLDGCNGLFLSPHVDRLFDRGLISFQDGGNAFIVETRRSVLGSLECRQDEERRSFQTEALRLSRIPSLKPVQKIVTRISFDHQSSGPTSALPPKADMCGATRDVHFGPKADIGNWPVEDFSPLE